MSDIGQVQRIELEAWMVLSDPAMSVDEAAAVLSDAGNEILEIDREGRRIKVAHVIADQEGV